uniref:ORF36 n=1 Tax=Latid herpesvirus 1 TaxID=3096545 RepID=A0AB33V6M0_9VIRU
MFSHSVTAPTSIHELCETPVVNRDALGNYAIESRFDMQDDYESSQSALRKFKEALRSERIPFNGVFCGQTHCLRFMPPPGKSVSLSIFGGLEGQVFVIDDFVYITFKAPPDAEPETHQSNRLPIVGKRRHSWGEQPSDSETPTTDTTQSPNPQIPRRGVVRTLTHRISRLIFG